MLRNIYANYGTVNVNMKIFLDTAPVIYFLDYDKRYAEKMKEILYSALINRTEIITSAITVTEYLTYPCRTGNIEKINVFFEFLNDTGIRVVPIDILTARKAAEIRADYQTFKTMDALQLASACVHECDIFLTNDKQLCQFSEIQCVTLD